MFPILNNLVNVINLVLTFFGIIFVLWGGVEAAIRVIYEDMRGEQDELVERRNRKAFASKLILGLEFFIAVDILSAFEYASWDSLGKLAALIIIRALLSVILSFEIKSIR